MHYFKPVRKIENKIWLSKYGRWPVVAKNTMSRKKVLYAIFFSYDGIAIQVPVLKGKMSLVGINVILYEKSQEILPENMSSDKISTCLSTA